MTAPAPRPIRKLLIANRGEIALRVIRAAHEAGLATVAVYSDADRGELHVRGAHEAVRLGPPPPRESYLSIDAIIAACRHTGADAVHPGYGFLSENPAFREACDAAGVTFIGPPASAMRVMGDKVSARRTAQAAGVPVTPGAELPHPNDDATVIAAAERVGFPLLVKAARGGGGKGIRRVERKEEMVEAVRRAASEAKTSFGSDVGCARASRSTPTTGRGSTETSLGRQGISGSNRAGAGARQRSRGRRPRLRRGPPSQVTTLVAAKSAPGTTFSARF